MLSSIYLITNRVNDKKYVGFTTNPVERIKQHRRNSNYLEYALYRAIRKYSIENFSFEIIYQSLDYDHCLKIMEPYFIKEYKSFGETGYNMTSGDDGKYIFSTETRNKISNKLKNKKKSPSHILHLSQSGIGRSSWNKGIKTGVGGWKGPRTEEYKKHLSEINKQLGIRPKNCESPKSQKTKEKISMSLSKNWKYTIIDESNTFEITNYPKFCKDNNINTEAFRMWCKKHKHDNRLHPKYKMKILSVIAI